ncbi:Polycomb-like protein [Phytophthora megakarya]|uniref:Polycomb-like protein n=1 Tax=Phytophthora megakarya TaxID=4795 RepID=A0A225WYK3_9STRA|nr:Polycomb-like protein [Phytophthora megakarya]
MYEDDSRKRPHEVIDLDETEADELSETDMEEQLCAQAAEALNHFIRSYHIDTSTEVARNRHINALSLLERRRRRMEYPIIPDESLILWLGVIYDYLLASEMPVDPDRQVKHTVKFQLSIPSSTVYKRAVILPKVPPIPTATMWTALSKNYEVEDEPTLQYLPYFGDDDEEDVVSEFYQIKQQRTSACEVEFTKDMCEGVLKTLQSTWDLTSSDLKRVANVIKVEEEVLIEVHKKLQDSHRAAKKKRRETLAQRNSANKENSSKDDFDALTNISMEEYFKMYEKSIDSYRSLFCRRCFVYDCDYHGCLEQPDLSISEQNAVALNLKENEIMINTGRNCGNHCFLGQMSSPMINGFSKAHAISATFGWSKQTRIICARAYFLCAGNFCEIAKILGDKTCMEVAEMCAYYDINDRSLAKEVRHQPKSRRSKKKKSTRMSIAHLQSTCACFDKVGLLYIFYSQNGVVNSVQIKIESCSHEGPCEPGVCSCVEDGIFCSKHCHCIHDACKIFFPGCQCQRGRCRTKACPCFCAGRECDIDLCRVCCMDEIAAREKREPYGSNSDKANKDDKQQTSCQNRSIALGKQKHVRMGRSKLSAAGWGLYVEEFVAKDEFIIEYIGEMVSQEEADRRGSVYDKVDRSYLFNLDTKTVIDSTRKGNKTRFINHSSENPNCACKIMNVSSDFRIGLFAIHDIQPHTEVNNIISLALNSILTFVICSFSSITGMTKNFITQNCSSSQQSPSG